MMTLHIRQESAGYFGGWPKWLNDLGTRNRNGDAIDEKNVLLIGGCERVYGMGIVK